MICDILFVLHNFSAYHTSHHMWNLLWDGKVKRKKKRENYYFYLLLLTHRNKFFVSTHISSRFSEGKKSTHVG